MAGTTSDKLLAILNSKREIRSAIESKGVQCGSDVPLSGYAEKILAISGSGVVYGTVDVGGSIFGVRVDIAGVGQYVKETIQ